MINQAVNSLSPAPVHSNSSDSSSLSRSQQNEILSNGKTGLKSGIRKLSSETMNIFAEMRQKGQLTDIDVKSSDDVIFKVHRPILASRSPFFRALFTSDFRERNKHTITLPYESELLAEIINFAYTKEVRLTPENVQDMITAGGFFLMNELVQVCSNYIATHLTDENCMEIIRFAKWHNFRRLAKKAQNYLKSRFSSVWQTSLEYLEMPPEELLVLLQDDQLNVRSETEVWEALLRWIQHDPSRTAHLGTLVRSVRLGLLPRGYFTETVYSHPFVRDNEDLQPIMLEVMKIFYNNLETDEFPTNFPHLANSSMLTPRLPNAVLLAIGGWSVGSPTNCIESYDVRANKWVRMENMGDNNFGPRAYHGALVLNDDIYIIGGFDGVDYYNSVRVFDTKRKVWTDKSPMHCRRCYISVAVVDGCIYAMGGFDGHVRMNTVEKYDPATNQWSFVAPMHSQRSDAHAAVLDGKIFICGGFSGQECMATVECYDPTTNVWSMKTHMINRRSGVGVVAYQQKVYAIGGFNGTQRLTSGECYNPKTDSWTLIPTMHSPRSNFAIEVLEDMIYTMGGFNGTQTVASVEAYNPATQRWQQIAEMGVNRSALYTCVLRDMHTVLEYCYHPRGALWMEKKDELIPNAEATNGSIGSMRRSPIAIGLQRQHG